MLGEPMTEFCFKRLLTVSFLSVTESQRKIIHIKVCYLKPLKLGKPDCENNRLIRCCWRWKIDNGGTLLVGY